MQGSPSDVVNGLDIDGIRVYQNDHNFQMEKFLTILRSMFSECFPPRTKWTPADMPDLTGQVVIVTGGNAGVGKNTVKALLEHNAKVYLAARSKQRAEAAIAELKTATGKEAIFLELDLSSLASVRKAAEEFLSKEIVLNVLFNNAGVMWCPKDQVTVDGFDMQFGTNVVGHFFFAELLIPALLEGVRSSPDRLARVVTTSSVVAYIGALDWKTFKDSPERRKKSVVDLYNQSKHANVVIAVETARRYGDKGIVSMAVNPGNLNTDLMRNMHPVIRVIVPLITYPPPMGAITQLWAGTSPETKDFNGQYLIPWARQGRCRGDAYDPEIGKMLYEYLQEQVKGF